MTDRPELYEINLEEIKENKKERAEIMLKNGYDLEDIKTEVWDTVDVECQGTCQGWLTKEEDKSGLDMCWGCKSEAMN